jgi:tetratricopeptide (TPR) repeat protein
MYDKAIEELTKNHSIYRDENNKYSFLGKAYFLSYNYNEAISVLTKAIDNNEKKSINYYYKGCSNFIMQKYKNAYNDFAMAKDLNDQKDPTPLYHLDLYLNKASYYSKPSIRRLFFGTKQLEVTKKVKQT